MTYQDAIADVEATVTSPDRNIEVRLVGGEAVEVGFLTGAYSRYTEETLARQLESLVKLVIVSRNRMKGDAMELVSGGRWRGDGLRPLSSSEKEFRRTLEDLEIEAHSDRISIWAKPDSYWDIEIQPGSLPLSSGSGFVEELLEVVSDVFTNMNVQVRAIREQVLGPGLLGDLKPKKTKGLAG